MSRFDYWRRKCIAERNAVVWILALIAAAKFVFDVIRDAL